MKPDHKYSYPNTLCMRRKYLSHDMRIPDILKHLLASRMSTAALFLISFSVLFLSDAQAQRFDDDSSQNSFEWTAPEAPSDGSTAPQPPTPPGEGPAQTPIDGGLGLLLAAGGAYAVRRLRNKGEAAIEK